MSAPEAPATPAPSAPTATTPTASAPSATTNDPLSQAAINALYEQNQQAYWTMMNVQKALDAYAPQTATPDAQPTPDTTSAPPAPGPSNTPAAPSAPQAPDYSTVDFDLTGGGGGSEGGSETLPILPVFGGSTGDGSATPGTSLNYPYYGFSNGPSQNGLSFFTSNYIPSPVADRSTEVPITDFSKFSFPTQPVMVTSTAPIPVSATPASPAASSVQDVYPLFDTETKP